MHNATFCAGPIRAFYYKMTSSTRVQLLYTLIHRTNIANIIQEGLCSAVSIHHTIDSVPVISPVWRDPVFMFIFGEFRV